MSKDAITPEQDVLTIQQAAALLGFTVQTTRLLAERGRIKGKKFGSRWRFSRRALLDSLVGK